MKELNLIYQIGIICLQGNRKRTSVFMHVTIEESNTDKYISIITIRVYGFKSQSLTIATISY